MFLFFMSFLGLLGAPFYFLLYWPLKMFGLDGPINMFFEWLTQLWYLL